MIEIKAPNPYKINMKRGTTATIFLAGSIEMGKAENWQKKLVSRFQGVEGIVFLNPRRNNWDASWVQSIDNPQFNEQVTWELVGLEDADIIAMYFDPATTSPITLLELGLWATWDNERLVVCCPDGYYRQGNVEIVCERYGVWHTRTWDEFVKKIDELIYNE